MQHQGLCEDCALESYKKPKKTSMISALALRSKDNSDNDDDYDVNEFVKDVQRKESVVGFRDKIASIQQNKMKTYRPIEIDNIQRTLFEAMIFPEYAKGVKFPAPFQIPTYTFQQKNSFTISTNAAGNAFVQINFGQFMDANIFRTGIAGVGVAGANASGYYNTTTGVNQNGTSTVGNSTIFFCNDATLNGVTQVSNAGNVMQAINVNQVNPGTFNTVRAGKNI
jgi:hypothetical protein